VLRLGLCAGYRSAAVSFMTAAPTILEHRGRQTRAHADADQMWAQ
jgi:hypothetical protein